MKCKQCNKEIKPISGRGKQPIHCSDECRQIYLKKYRQRYYYDRYTAVLPGPCVKCGTTENIFSFNISIGGDKTDPNNFIPLCSNCRTDLRAGEWNMWDIADQVRSQGYETQYWLIQILKYEGHHYNRQAKRIDDYLRRIDPTYEP